MTLNQNANLSIKSITPIIQELERAATWFTAKYDLKELEGQHHVVNIYTGGKPAKCYGWFKGKAKEKGIDGVETGNLIFPWYEKQDDGSQDGVCEIMMTGEFLNRPVLQILSTLFHEMVHATAEARGIGDVSASGRHNKKFADLCDNLGLDCIQDEKGSWSETSLRPMLLDAIESELEPAYGVFNLAAGTFQPKPKTQNKRHKYVCQCETGIQRKGAEFRTYQAAVLHGQCYDCKADFTLAD